MDELDRAVARLHGLGIHRVESFAWRDLDDPEAGGSELHADEIFSRWAAAGLTLAHRTSTVDEPRAFTRNGYAVEQRGGRYDVFARVVLSQMWRRLRRGRADDVATVEIWNGVPWFGPCWAPDRRVVWMHHVHRDMWADVLPRPFDALGRLLETRLAPLFYRRSSFATLSESSATEIEAIGIAREQLTVIPPGVHERFEPAPDRRSTVPEVVVVGRLAPVKRQVLALEALGAARERVPDLRVCVVGDGPDRAAVERWVTDNDAAAWVTLAGRVSDAELVEAYQSAWLVVSASHAEGWGMSLTEGGACGTPCVATDIAGHRGAAVDGVTGVLVDELDRFADEIADLLLDPARRATLADAARVHASGLSWRAVAARQLDVLGDSVAASR